MEQFSYHFMATLLHSLWQTALLLIFYGVVLMLQPRQTPLSKRNMLLATLATQVLLSIATFYLLASNAAQGLLSALTNSVGSFVSNSWLPQHMQLVFLSYLVIVSLLIASSCWQWNLFKTRYKKTLQKASLELRLFTQCKALEFGISRKVTLWCSNHITSPMTFGFWKPVILLPMALVNQLSMQEAEVLIIHELTHIRHKDYLLNWGLLLVESVFFFNPFVRFIARAIKMEREKNCDIQVLNFKYCNILYAETLLKTSRVQQQLSLQLAAVKNKKQLFQRIHFFSSPANLQFQKTRGGFLLATYFTALLTAALAVVTITQTKPAAIFSKANSPAKNTALPVKTVEETTVSQTTSTETITQKNVVTTTVKFTEETSKKKHLVKEPELPEPKEILSEDAPGFLAMPASIPEMSMEGKEIIIKDQGTDGKTITAAYHALLIDGIWTLQPLWLISEIKANKGDSLATKKRDSVMHLFPGAL